MNYLQLQSLERKDRERERDLHFQPEDTITASVLSSFEKKKSETELAASVLKKDPKHTRD